MFAVHPSNNIGIMFLNEVALGKEYTITQDDSSLRKAPAGYDSVIARGSQEPGFSKYNQNSLLISLYRLVHFVKFCITLVLSNFSLFFFLLQIPRKMSSLSLMVKRWQFLREKSQNSHSTKEVPSTTVSISSIRKASVASDTSWS